ncbi:CBS domain-containing protein [Yoonia maricola]|uniref:CBS domain-containing protein n=1 Tax=Yoonia maricola TaxID=420999 RepID=A0A2M8WKW1_9RHOB|nr:CBS domain-containing protein [Yoonia maricola]PJI91565.1 CBS domain-containing protein [Yoonia maricola]
MLVSQMLKSKPEMGVISVQPNATVTEAAKLLSEHRIGTVVVSKDGETLDGILSERDIVRELGKRGTACFDDPVSALMTAKLTTCSPSNNALEVLEIMTNGRFRHLPVMDDGKMVGLISIGDAVKGRLAQLAMEKESLEGMIMGH